MSRFTIETTYRHPVYRHRAPVMDISKSGRGEIRPVKFMRLKPNTTETGEMAEIERTLRQHPAITMIFLMEGSYHYMIKIDEIPEDRTADIVNDLRKLNLLNNTITYSVIDQIM